MAIKKHLLVLANSAKQGGRCLAGRILENRNGSYVACEWVRPVMPHHNGCDSMPEAVCRQVNPLDVVTLELSSAAPVVGQDRKSVVKGRGGTVVGGRLIKRR